MSVAVVKDGEVVFSLGFGHRDNDQKLPVTTWDVPSVNDALDKRLEAFELSYSAGCDGGHSLS
jgi:hypothetical protein